MEYDKKKLDERLVGVLKTVEKTPALVKVRSRYHLNMLEKNFDVSSRYPFIRSLGINCGVDDLRRLERMQEVEYVSAQSKVTALFDHEMKNYFQSKVSDKASCEMQNISQSKVSDKASCEMQNISQSKVSAHTKSATQDNQQNENNISHSTTAASAYQNGDRSVFELSKSLTGDGVTLCVLDTGISPHSDLSVPKERIIHFVDMINEIENPYDDNGHGTFVSGVAVGNGLLSGGKVCGIAPKANLVGIKVITTTGETGTFKILDGMQWLFDNFKKYDIKVVCMSFGAEPMQYADPLKLGVEMLVRSGLTVVCASGNSGNNGLKSPGISSEVICVGAVDDKDNIAEFSSFGSYNGVIRPDLYAQGVKIRGITAGGTYSMMSGTSVSAPYIAGACCLLHQKYKNINPWQVKSALMQSSYAKNGNRIFSMD